MYTQLQPEERVVISGMKLLGESTRPASTISLFRSYCHFIRTSTLNGALENLASTYLRISGFRRRVWISLGLGSAEWSRSPTSALLPSADPISGVMGEKSR